MKRPHLPQRATRRDGLHLPLFGHVALLIGTSLALLAASGALLWTALGRPHLAGRTAWTVENTFDAIKILLAIVAGIGGVVALTVAYRRQHLGESAERRENTKLFNDRFAKAAELIGSDKAAVRLAGIHAIAALADDWLDGRQTCIDVLCAYLRMPYTPPPPPPPPPAPPAETPTSAGSAAAQPVGSTMPDAALEPAGKPARDPYEERQVRHTIIRIIGDHLRLPSEHHRSWTGCDLDFTDVLFDGGDFHGATFSGGIVDFRRARFSDGTVDFREATFSDGTVDFRGATFSGGTVTFGKATFSGGTVKFRRATFSSGTVIFGGATFSGGAVEFAQAAFSGGTVIFGGAAFSGGTVNFDWAKFSDGKIGFREARFSDGTVDFREARFSGGTVEFDRAAFSNGTVDFDRAAFFDGTVDFDWAKFSGGTVKFREARFFGSTVGFREARFSDGTVDFDGAKFSDGIVDFRRAKFSDGTVDFREAKFSDGTVDFGRGSGHWSVCLVFDAEVMARPPVGLRLPEQTPGSLPS